jgi:hypothetical protein
MSRVALGPRTELGRRGREKETSPWGRPEIGHEERFYVMACFGSTCLPQYVAARWVSGLYFTPTAPPWLDSGLVLVSDACYGERHRVLHPEIYKPTRLGMTSLFFHPLGDVLLCWAENLGASGLSVQSSVAR